MRFSTFSRAFRLKLRTAAGDTLTVVDADILCMDKDHGHSYLDTQRGMGRCTWDLQKPDYSERANVLYLRLRSCDGASVERIAVDSTKLSMEMEFLDLSGSSPRSHHRRCRCLK